VFVGGFDLPAAEAVCGVDPLDATEVLDLLGSLVEKSLVMVDEREEGSRYRMLETIREYVREKLDQRGEDAAATATRHCQHFFAFAKQARAELEGPQQADAIRRVEADIDNLRAATALALAGGVDPFIAVKLAVALQGFWILRGYASEGREVVRSALALPAVQSSELAQAWALYSGANLANSQGDDREAERMLERCLSLRRGIGNPMDIAATLSTLSAVRLRLGNASSAREGEIEALAIFRQLGKRSEEAIVLLHLGEICVQTGEDEEARRFLEQSLAIAREIKYQETETDCERTLGQLALEHADRTRARFHFENALGASRAAEDRRGAACATWWLGKVDVGDGDTSSAQRRLSEALRCFEAFEMRAETVGCVEDCGQLARSLGLTFEAVRLYAAATASRERLALPRLPRTQGGWQGEIDAARRALGDDFETAWAEGYAWALKTAVSSALAVTSPSPGQA